MCSCCPSARRRRACLRGLARRFLRVIIGPRSRACMPGTPPFAPGPLASTWARPPWRSARGYHSRRSFDVTALTGARRAAASCAQCLKARHTCRSCRATSLARVGVPLCSSPNLFGAQSLADAGQQALSTPRAEIAARITARAGRARDRRSYPGRWCARPSNSIPVDACPARQVPRGSRCSAT